MGQLPTAAELRAEMAHQSHQYEVLGTLPLGEELIAVRVGGNRRPPVMITAGSHADEIAGVMAVLRILREPQTECEVYAIPVRDPLGWNGFAWCLDRALGISADVATHDHAARILREQGEVLVDDPDGGLVLALVGDLAFATMPEESYLSYQLCRRLLGPIVAERAPLRERLAGKRIILPGNRACPGGHSHYGRGGHTAFVGEDGWVGHFNRFFDRADAPPEVALTRAYVDKVQPALAVDLHEGFGDKYYVFVPPMDSPLDQRIGAAMINAVADRGYPISTYEELSVCWGPTAKHIQEAGRGLYLMAPDVQETGPSFNWYSRRYGPAFTTESGMGSPLGVRTDFVEWSVRAAISTFENWYSRG